MATGLKPEAVADASSIYDREYNDRLLLEELRIENEILLSMAAFSRTPY